MDDKLWSCPFCGQTPQLNQFRDSYFIFCPGCTCTLGGAKASKEEVIEKWNTRIME